MPARFSGPQDEARHVAFAADSTQVHLILKATARIAAAAIRRPGGDAVGGETFTKDGEADGMKIRKNGINL